jgi:hypothetical protein
MTNLKEQSRQATENTTQAFGVGQNKSYFAHRRGGGNVAGANAKMKEQSRQAIETTTQAV